MNIITKKVRLIPAPFVGTRIKIVLDDPESLTWGIRAITFADGCQSAVIDWGDGIREEVSSRGNITHTYRQSGEYELRISDDIKAIGCSTSQTESEFYLVYAPMIREFRTTATRMSAIVVSCLRNATHMSAFSLMGSGVKTIGAYAFDNCSSLNGGIDLPGVNNVMPTSFTNSPGITELKFSEANKAAITSLDGYKDKFGATNATISFDL